MQSSSLHFGDFELDGERFQLLRNGHSLPLERKPLELLLLLAGSGGRLVTRTEIAERLWGHDVFVDTEHGINTAIRKVRAALRDDPSRPRFVETVTGMGYRFIAPLQQPPSTSALAAAASVIVPPPSVQPLVAAAATGLALPTHTPGKWRLRLLFALALTIIAGTTWTLFASRHRPANSVRVIRSVAVLPLSNVSGDAAQDYFAAGMTDELITSLTLASTLRIPSRTSVTHLKTQSGSLAEITRTLGVDAIVEGSIQRAPDRVHLNLQLIDTATDSHVWAESYDRSLAQASSLPTEAAQAIASRLQSPSGTQPASRYVSPEAHDAWLRGHYLWSVHRNDEAGEAYERAVSLQPDYALGWTGVSQYYGRGAIIGELDPAIALPREQQAADRAMALDPGLPQAHSMMAAALFFYHWDPEAALREIQRASALEPNSSEILHLHALILATLGRYDEALAVQRRATAADPVTHPVAYAEILLAARDFDEAVAETRMRLRDFPGSHELLYVLVEALHDRGSPDAEVAPLAARLYPVDTAGTAPSPEVLGVFRQGGFRAFVRWKLRALQHRQAQHYVSQEHLARCYAQLGENETALRLLSSARQHHDPVILSIGADPAYDGLANDRRFAAILQGAGVRPVAAQNP